MGTRYCCGLCWKPEQEIMTEQSVAGYGPQAVAMQHRLLAAIVYSTAVGRRLNRDVGDKI